MVSQIFRITNIVTERHYIGATNRGIQSAIQHIIEYRKPLELAENLISAGPEAFDVQVVYTGDDHSHTLSVMLPDAIRQYQADTVGYNHIEPIRRDPQRVTGSKNPRSPETRRKLSKAMIGKRYHLGHKHTEEAKRRIGAAKKQWHADNPKPKRPKPPRVVKEMEVFHWCVYKPDGTKERITSLRKFCKENGLDKGNMIKASRGIISHHKGYRCKLLEITGPRRPLTLKIYGETNFPIHATMAT
jgi:hypothetical protein